MKQFLLLRSNKQSGPYSADDLQQMGLKPYDLIWVDGKSAAWRYPGEIDDLKSFAPPVEEQPYDRFYKKPEPENKVQETPVQTPVVSIPPTARPMQPAENKPVPKKEKEYKRIFVTLPSGASVQAPAPKPNPVADQPAPSAFGTTLQPEHVADETNYEAPKPLPSAKARTAQKEPVSDRQREEIYYPAKRSIRIKPVVLASIVIGMVCMIALGIFIGVSINQKQGGVSMIKKVDPVNTNSVIPSTEQNTNSNTALNQTDPLVGEIKQNEEPGKQQIVPIVPPAKKAKPAVDSGKQQVAADLSLKNDSDAVVIEKEEPVKKPTPKPVVPNLEKMVAVSSNDYQVGPFGGISKLELTVKNSSDYNLNLVVVEVEYLKVNKEVFKTEKLYFRDVAANSSLTLDAPRSNRGNKVNYKVTLV
ncbi:MAG: hypothetical protein WCF67_16210, partial [Chitinophagaceae bacterium]